MIVKKPTIIIYACSPDAQLLSEVCAGIEEEGILFETVAVPVGAAEALSVRACDESMLGVGIGITGSTLSLHIRGMNIRSGNDEKTALLFCENADADAARALGSNGARVIKKTPLRLPD